MTHARRGDVIGPDDTSGGGSSQRQPDDPIASTDVRTESLAVTGDLGNLARGGALWGVIAQVAQQALSVLATLVLARLLTPADFGIITAAVTVLQMAQLVLAMGWSTAILRRPEVDDAYLSSVFWLVTGLAAALAVTVAVGAPFLTGLIGLPHVAPYLGVLALSAVPVAAQMVPASLLGRRLRLKAMHISAIVGVVVYVIVQVVLAVLGAGAWAVILGMVAQSLVQFVAVCLVAQWWPRFIFRRNLVSADFRFASGLLFYNGLNYGVRNADYWVVGRTLGAAALGAYYVAYVLPQILRLRVTWVASAVLFPVLAHTRSDPERTQQIYAHSLLLCMWIGFPAMVGLAVLAEPVMSVFFGPQWGGAVEPLRWLAFVALVDFATFGPPAVAQVHGHVRRLLVTNVVRLVLLVGAVAVAGTVFRSLGAVAAGVLFATVIYGVYQQFALARPLGLAFAPLVKDLGAIAVLATLMGVVVGLLRGQIGDTPEIVQIMTCTVVGAALYFALGWLLFRRVTAPLMRSVFMSLRTLRSRTATDK